MTRENRVEMVSRLLTEIAKHPTRYPRAELEDMLATMEWARKQVRGALRAAATQPTGKHKTGPETA